MNLSKREALFRKLDKRHEDHQAAKEQRSKENSEQDVFFSILQKNIKMINIKSRIFRGGTGTLQQ